MMEGVDRENTDERGKRYPSRQLKRGGGEKKKYSKVKRRNSQEEKDEEAD